VDYGIKIGGQNDEELNQGGLTETSVAAAYKAIDKINRGGRRLLNYALQAIDCGEDFPR
jgi:hypothetical protein